ncbi:hypothetical protein ACFCZV_15140 [Streptomyces hydrogenans]|uniref:hypothetical protein n=1 Tax=Streptomyces hydrogenans TaxID=1873719 RepID=UPI0035E0B8AD
MDRPLPVSFLAAPPVVWRDVFPDFDLIDRDLARRRGLELATIGVGAVIRWRPVHVPLTVDDLTRPGLPEERPMIVQALRELEREGFLSRIPPL